MEITLALAVTANASMDRFQEDPNLRGLTPVTEEVGGNPSMRTLEATDTVERFPSGTVCQGGLRYSEV